MASKVNITKETIWEHLEKHTNEAVAAIIGSGYSGVTSFVKLSHAGNLLRKPNSSCHYDARYGDPYVGLWTTTYIGTTFPTSLLSGDGQLIAKYARKHFPSRDDMYQWWTEFLMSVINDPDSYYHPLKDYVRLHFNSEGRPIAWVISGEAPHTCMTSFLVCTRKIREKYDPMYVHKLIALFPELKPMQVFSLAMIVEMFKNNSDNFFKSDKGYKLSFYPLNSLKNLWQHGGHCHIANFHPHLHAPKLVKYGDCTFNKCNGDKTTYESLGSGWTSTKVHNDFKAWIKTYGTKAETVKPLFHTLDPNKKSTSIPLDAFVPQFLKFLYEVNQ